MTGNSETGALFVLGGPPELTGALAAEAGSHRFVQAIPIGGSLGPASVLSSANASIRPMILLAPQPERDDGEEWLRATRRLMSEAPTALVTLLSSIEIYSPDHQSVGMVAEDTERRPAIENARAEFWEAVEAGVRDTVPPDRLLILRAAHVIGQWAHGWFNRLLLGKRVLTVAGHDPSLQLIHESELVRAVLGAMERRLTGLYNLAPPDALPLRRILKAAGVRRVPLPWAFLCRFRARDSGEEKWPAVAARRAYLRYPCTACGDRLAGESDVALSTVRALGQFLKEGGKPSPDLAEFSDPHGLDARYIHTAANRGCKFFEKVYWRIERRGFEHIPQSGPAILVGPHRGFMPVDAVMMVQMVTKYTGRVPRFLLHPSLVKVGILARFMRRMGGVMACRKNANDVLKRGDLLGIYPEGIRGPFKYYREVYQYGRFGRPDYARFALEHGAPVVPFVTVGCAEIYPIYGKLKWQWVKDHLEWPCLPVTPTFPFFLQVPLPTKWHLHILPPIYPQQAIEEAERTGREPYQVIVEQVRKSIEDATAEMLAKRKSIFFGRVLGE